MELQAGAGRSVRTRALQSRGLPLLVFVLLFFFRDSALGLGLEAPE